ncbi:hypothetical protein ACFL6U_00505 [Planctomycetota bacterium]
MKHYYGMLTALVLLFLFSGLETVEAQEFSIVLDLDSMAQVFGVTQLEIALHEIKRQPVRVPLDQATGQENLSVRIIADPNKEPSIKEEGFRIRRHTDGKLAITAIDEIGVMYGLMEMGELIALNGIDSVTEKTVNPRFPFRAIKVNLSWSVYGPHPARNLHKETLRDLKFWESFLDMMAQNRFNAITLWNLHPFPYMIRAKNFPKACPFTDEELAEWKELFSGIFRMAKERGIDSYAVHWNIFVSESYRKHYSPNALTDAHSGGQGTTNPLDDRYLKESVTQLINEYPDLTGIGITLGEGMNKMTAQERQDWLLRTEVAGIRAANRKVKFIHRAPMYTTNLEVEKACRAAIDSIDDMIPPLEFEVKFNWSHGHSTPELIKIHGGKPTGTYWDPVPTNYRVDWMVRNEDFFVLRWGQPDFIREHIAVNGHSYVNGYFIGSECYIPAKDYIHVRNHEHVNWKYAFERQWLFYQQWGRLLYDPTVSDETFELEFDRRFGQGVGESMVKAYKLASDIQLDFVCTMRDFTSDTKIYSESFGTPRFLDIKGVMNAKVFDDTYYSVKDYVSDSLAGSLNPDRITPFAVADRVEKNAKAALAIVKPLTGSSTLHCEIDDVRAWSCFGYYFAKKLRAAVLLQGYLASDKQKENDKAKAVALLKEAKDEWAKLVGVTKDHYHAIPITALHRRLFSWELRSKAVDKDIIMAEEM